MKLSDNISLAEKFDELVGEIVPDGIKSDIGDRILALSKELQQQQSDLENLETELRRRDEQIEDLEEEKDDLRHELSERKDRVLGGYIEKPTPLDEQNI